MEPRICQDESEAARFVSRWTEERIRKTKAKALFLPAGATPVPLYRLWEKERPDAVAGLDTNIPGATGGRPTVLGKINL